MARPDHRRRRRRKMRFERRTRPGASPGTLTAHPQAPAPIIDVIAYGADYYVEQRVESVEQIAAHLGRHPTIWVNIDGLGEPAVIERLGALFKLHPLALEDVVNVHQRAKVDPYESHLFIVARMVSMAETIDSEQMSLFLGRDFVVTFQERPGDCLDAVRERIRRGGGRLRGLGADYLAYRLLDAVVDSYFPVLDAFADRVDALEEELAGGDSLELIERIHVVRNELLLLRRWVRPHREAVNELVRDEHPLVSRETRLFLRDVYDHTVQLIDLLEVYRDMCAGLRDYHLSLISNRMNEAIKVLTMIATIFIPLSFIAGVYGMNFDTRSPWNMPELSWRFGYFIVWGLMLAVFAGLVAYFRKKGWMRLRRR